MKIGHHLAKLCVQLERSPFTTHSVQSGVGVLTAQAMNTDWSLILWQLRSWDPRLNRSREIRLKAVEAALVIVFFDRRKLVTSYPVWL